MGGGEGDAAEGLERGRCVDPCGREGDRQTAVT